MLALPLPTPYRLSLGSCAVIFVHYVQFFYKYLCRYYSRNYECIPLICTNICSSRSARVYKTIFTLCIRVLGEGTTVHLQHNRISYCTYILTYAQAIHNINLLARTYVRTHMRIHSLRYVARVKIRNNNKRECERESERKKNDYKGEGT